MKSSDRELLYLLISALLVLIFVLLFISLLQPPPEISPVSKPFFPSREFRGIWMSRFDYTQNLNSTDKEVIQNYIKKTFQWFKEANLNTVFFQVRGNADAFYRSNYEPWSQLLTGVLGQDPGWDPLQFAIHTAHELGLELHAWINVFPAWRGKIEPTPSTPIHPVLAHPEWIVCDSIGKPMSKSESYTFFSPGNPEVHRHIINVLMEITSKYEIDGIHFDYIRYPEGSAKKGYSHDKVSATRFLSYKTNPLRLDWENWQREQLTSFVAKAYNAITSIKPWIKVSAAVIGNYNQSSWSGYNAVYQDAARWATIGKIDIIVPLNYRSRENDSFRKIIESWKNIPNIQKPIVTGIGAYILSFEDLLKEVDDVRSAGLNGMAFFAASSFDSTQLNRLKSEKFKLAAIPPAMPWKYKNPPPAPDSCVVTSDSLNLIFNWKQSRLPEKRNFIRNYVIYSSAENSIDITNAAFILTILPWKSTCFVTAKEPNNNNRNYFIAAIDAANNASELVQFLSDSSAYSGY
jgi:uncharacterized lipoprotein YddW (UPF0748 family)